ncbi:putative methylesterase 12, chloroplastic [Macadamia integrifolia]|uniref:putative methylesterase 12, chloroplastic n=1 Tax=Macadamia integrifolia TaxID=60698 RepID=UPI001C52FA54|nr:putative methylesterase 12, chloroplastic [Macadamia integrifolia]
MGNNFICMKKKDWEVVGSKSKRHGRSQRKMPAEEELLHRQALSIALHQHQMSQRFDGSMSRRIGSTSARFGSTSSRRRTLSDPFSNGKQVPEFLENLKTKKVVLVHGAGFGAWCWYKTIALLEEVGLLPVALDLMGSGIDQSDPNSITTLADYVKPLVEYLHNLPEDEQVLLVGHSCGGASISYVLEYYPKKISKAIFLCGTMVADGQKPFDVFAEELGSIESFMQESQLLMYGNGKDKPPTSLMLEKQQMKGLYFNQCSDKDIALATVSMRPIPLGPIMEKVSMSPENYVSSRRFYIQTLEDHALSPDVQEKLVRENPPEGVFKIKGSDHCPFFSKPQSLHKILLEIAQIP